MIWNWKTV